MADAANVDDAAFWDDVYRRGEDGWELGAPSPPLVRAVGALGRPRAGASTAAVLGCGRGHEARLLAGAGWGPVVAFDFAPRALAGARGLGTPPGVEWREADVFTIGATDPGRFDLALEHTCFCAIDPRRRLEWARAVHAALRPGGRLLALFYAHGRPGGPPFTTTAEEVRAVLGEGGRFAIERFEPAPPDSIERRRGAEILVLARAAGRESAGYERR